MTMRQALQRLAWIVSQVIESGVHVEEQDSLFAPEIHVCQFCGAKADVLFSHLIHSDSCPMTAITALMGELEEAPDHGKAEA